MRGEYSGMVPFLKNDIYDGFLVLSRVMRKIDFGIW